MVDGVLYYAEMGNDRVMRFDGETNTPVWERERCGPTAVAPTGDGSLAVLCHHEEIVARISRNGALLDVIDRDEDGRAFSNPNAAVSDGKGGIYFSSSGSFAPGRGRPAQCSMSTLRGGCVALPKASTTPTAWRSHLTEGSLYVSEHLGRRVLAFDIAADGSLSDRRTYVFARRPGRFRSRAELGGRAGRAQCRPRRQPRDRRIRCRPTAGRQQTRKAARHDSRARTLRHRLGLQRRPVRTSSSPRRRP